MLRDKFEQRIREKFLYRGNGDRLDKLDQFF